MWGHKIFKPVKVEEIDVTHKYKEIMDIEIRLSTSPVSDYTFKDLVATYRIVGGWEVHVTALRSSIAGSSGWNGTNPFTTKLEVYSMSYTDIKGKIHRGASAVQVGQFYNPVKWRAEVQRGIAPNRDILHFVEWNKNAESKSEKNPITLSFNIGLGPLNLSYTPNFTRKSIKEANQANVWNGGDQYPGNLDVNFANTFLNYVGQYYNGRIYVTHNGSTLTKRVNSIYTVPYFNFETSEYLGVTTMSNGVNYISR